MNIPKFINPNDHSNEANLARIQHYNEMYALTGGKGFRQPSKKYPTRIEILGNLSFGDKPNNATKTKSGRVRKWLEKLLG